MASHEQQYQFADFEPVGRLVVGPVTDQPPFHGILTAVSPNLITDTDKGLALFVRALVAHPFVSDGWGLQGNFKQARRYLSIEDPKQLLGEVKKALTYLEQFPYMLPEYHDRPNYFQTLKEYWLNGHMFLATQVCGTRRSAIGIGNERRCCNGSERLGYPIR